MKVKTYEVSVSTNSTHVSLKDLFFYLASEPRIIGQGENGERRFYVDQSNSTCYKGLVVTVKDQKSFCKLLEGNRGEITIEVENLEEKERLMEFNFFVLNKSILGSSYSRIQYVVVLLINIPLHIVLLLYFRITRAQYRL